MQYVLKEPILAFKYAGEPIDQLPSWVLEAAPTEPMKTPTQQLMVASGGQNAFGPAHLVLDQGDYLVRLAGELQKMSAREFEAKFELSPE